MVPKDDTLYLQDALDAINKIKRFLSSKTRGDFVDDELVISAAAYQAAIVGEALNKVSDDFQAEHSAIPWRKAISNRNFIVHDYGAINPTMLWDTCTVSMPALADQLVDILQGAD